MAGDHKCPVCSSTFTRPQHVARHMRSHTGDRPYKCVHCGDQFARSDLLSRHVNKCHASAKPPTTTQPARRKGHPQPGTSSAVGVRGPAPQLIPPPGTRRVCDPCARSRTATQCDSTLPCGKCLQRNTKCAYLESSTHAPSAPADVLSASPSTSSAPLTVPSMAPPLFPSQPDFNFTVPLYPQDLDPRSYRPGPAFSTHPPSLSLSTSTGESAESPTPSELALVLRHMQSHSYGNQPVLTHNIPQYTDPHKHLHQGYIGQQFGDLPDLLYPTSAAPDLNHQSEQPSRPNGHQPQQPQYSADTFYNESTQRNDLNHVFQQIDSFPQQQEQPRQQHPDDFPTLQEGGFSSAFGLMSLDDPAVAAEMAKNNSFFAPPKQSDVTPGRDVNISELRDFWKTFMRDNTPSEKAPSVAQTPANGRPGMRRSLSKIASLPDIKTPPAVDPTAAGPQYSTTEEARYDAHPFTEDLTSYQQAVLARKTPNLTLVLPNRNKRPSFKRLASQTLGPFESKSAKVSHSGVEAIAAYERCGGQGEAGRASVEEGTLVHLERGLSAPTGARQGFVSGTES